LISLKQYRRDTGKKTHIPEIDGLRFFAIITVVLFHLNTALTKSMGLELNKVLDLMGGSKVAFSAAWWFVRLDLGVKVFFAISGFVLALPFLKYFLGIRAEKVNIKSYFLRRLIRLEPPYIISLLMFLLIHVFLLDGNSIKLLWDFVAGLFYSHVLLFGEPNPINPVTWSLETEAQFYILVPILLNFIIYLKDKRAAIFVLIGLMIASICFKNHYNYHPRLGSTILSYFSNFAVGIIGCWIYLSNEKWMKNKSLAFDFIGLLSVFCLFYFYKPQYTYLNQVVFNCSILLFILSAFKGNLFNWIFTREFIYVLGGMCYSIYLIHYAFFHLSTRLTKIVWMDSQEYIVNLLLQVLINVPIVLLVSLVFYKYVEFPFMNRISIKK